MGTGVQKSNFFPLELTPFQKGRGLQVSKYEVTKVVSLVKMVENLSDVSSLLEQTVKSLAKKISVAMFITAINNIGTSTDIF